MKYTVDKKGFYGNFGGAFVPEMLFPNLDELEKNYNKIINDSNFQKDYNNLSKYYNSSLNLDCTEKIEH